MKMLYLGDVMGEMGIRAVELLLPQIVRTEGVDFVVAQSENVTQGKGMSIADYNRLQAAGVHAFTGGNHTPTRVELYPLLESPEAPVVGPLNMQECPGPGYKIVIQGQLRVLVVSILGNVVGKQAGVAVENPLQAIDKLLTIVPRGSYDVSVVNIHGDFSSEKVVLPYYLDGRVSLVVGDHWHVPTADAEVLPQHTARITDVGMCGSLDSSLGVTFDSIIPRWRDGKQTRNELETSGRTQLCAVLVAIDELTGEAESIRQIRQVW
jgi:metallophosphoesterase (TIGR00282 family)